MGGAALIHGTRLDRQLAAGVDPEMSTALSQRARWLQGARRRRALARSLERDIEMAERATPAAAAALPVNRDEVVRARPLLFEILERLREPEAVSARGVALVRLLLTDAASPIFSPGWSTAPARPGALERQARVVLAAFDRPGADQPVVELARQ